MRCPTHVMAPGAESFQGGGCVDKCLNTRENHAPVRSLSARTSRSGYSVGVAAFVGCGSREICRCDHEKLPRLVICDGEILGCLIC